MWGAEPSALAGGGFGDGGAVGGPCPYPLPPRQEGCASPSLAGQAPSQLQGSWRAEQELQGWAPAPVPSSVVPLQGPDAPVPCCDTWLGAVGTCPHLLHVTASTGSVGRQLPCPGQVCALQGRQHRQPWEMLAQDNAKEKPGEAEHPPLHTQPVWHSQALMARGKAFICCLSSRERAQSPVWKELRDLW